MANRVSVEELKEIVSTSLDDAVLEAFITAANLTVTEHLGSSASLSAAQLKEIERWLAAHFLVCTRERQAQSETVGGASITYQGKTDMGLDASFYGQQVKILDTSGVLAAAIGQRKASVYAIPSFDN